MKSRNGQLFSALAIVIAVIAFMALAFGPDANAQKKRRARPASQDAVDQALKGQARNAARSILDRNAPRRYTKVELKTAIISSEGMDLEYDQTMDSHTDYYFTAAGDGSVKQIDLEIADVLHQAITNDEGASRNAVVRWSPPEGFDDTYRIKIRILESRDPRAAISLWMAYGSK